MKNNLFAWLWHWDYAWPVYSAYNNLFYGGSTVFERYPGAGTWTVRDNVFDGAALTLTNQAVVNDHNAYVGSGQAQLPGSGGGDVVLSSFAYTNLAAWPSWRFYQVTTNLVDAGSRNATNAGLYHFTTQVSQAKETNSPVDIGFHYVAADTATGLALDADGDGSADCIEDGDGDGTVDVGETDWRSGGEPGLRVWIVRPRSNNPLP